MGPAEAGLSRYTSILEVYSVEKNEMKVQEQR
jgi:hypothetical protein